MPDYRRCDRGPEGCHDAGLPVAGLSEVRQKTGGDRGRDSRRGVVWVCDLFKFIEIFCWFMERIMNYLKELLICWNISGLINSFMDRLINSWVCWSKYIDLFKIYWSLVRFTNLLTNSLIYWKIYAITEKKKNVLVKRFLHFPKKGRKNCRFIEKMLIDWQICGSVCGSIELLKKYILEDYLIY